MSIVLSEPLLVRGIDIEAFCHERLVRWVERRGGLTPADQDEALSFLIVEAWRSSQRFDPERLPRRGSFRAFLSQRVSWAIQDWNRQWFGDDRYGPVPVIVSWEGLGPTARETALVDNEPLDSRLLGALADAVELPRSPDLRGRLRRRLWRHLFPREAERG